MHIFTDFDNYDLTSFTNFAPKAKKQRNTGKILENKDGGHDLETPASEGYVFSISCSHYNFFMDNNLDPSPNQDKHNMMNLSTTS